MILRRFYDDNLAQASYLVGCARTGESLVVDPNRDADAYIEAASREGLRITHVIETHIHADFVSGLRELCARTGARPYLSGEGGRDWQYAFAQADGAQVLMDGDTFMVGNIRVQSIHTPGHTPEHMTFMVTDTAGADQPMGAFTGDFIFAGDVGRPDLLEKAAGVAGTMQAAAQELFASLQSFKSNPDYLQLWPGHGAGSACGKALGAVPQTTLGYERLFNRAIVETREDAFVADILDGQPVPPRYFAQMKRINREGPSILGATPQPHYVHADQLNDILDAGGLVIDIRPWSEFAHEHVHRTVNIPLNKSFSTWAGSLVPYDADFHLLAPDAIAAERALRDLSMIGLDRVAGVFTRESLDAAKAAGRTRGSEQINVHRLAEEAGAGGVTILDVRNLQEWREGHIPAEQFAGANVVNIPLGQLDARIGEVPRDARLLVHCKAGGRSAIASSMLERHGIDAAVSVQGGFDAWRNAALPVSEADTAAST